jgi:glycosyltransferase involved in cell wall biosynthesis
MNVWAYTIVRNEREILPWWLRHYQSFCSRVIVFDDQSDDGTREIVQRSGAELRDLPYTGLDDGYQAAFSSGIYHEARGKADFVIVVDADEFVHGKIDPSWTFPFVQGYQMFGTKLPTQPTGQIYDYIKRGYPYAPESKPCLFRPELELIFSPGRHFASIPYVDDARKQLKLLHYRWFGASYYERRSARNYERLPERAALYDWGQDTSPTRRKGQIRDIGELAALAQVVV